LNYIYGGFGGTEPDDICYRHFML